MRKPIETVHLDGQHGENARAECMASSSDDLFFPLCKLNDPRTECSGCERSFLIDIGVFGNGSLGFDVYYYPREKTLVPISCFEALENGRRRKRGFFGRGGFTERLQPVGATDGE